MDQHTKITGATLKVNISGFETHDEEQGHMHVVVVLLVTAQV